MSTTQFAELTTELVETFRRLSPEDKGRLIEEFACDPDEADGSPEEVRAAQREEIQRRLDAVKSGDMPTYTLEEVLARVESRRRPRTHEDDRWCRRLDNA